MFCFNLFLAALLIADSNFPKSLCFEGSRTEHDNRVNQHEYEIETRETNVQSDETNPNGDHTDVNHTLFPRGGGGKVRWDSLKAKMNKPGSTKVGNTNSAKRSKSMDSKNSFSKPADCNWFTRLFTKERNAYIPPRQEPYDATRLLQCVLNATKKSLSSIPALANLTIGALTKGLSTSVSKVGELFKGKPDEPPPPPPVKPTFSARLSGLFKPKSNKVAEEPEITVDPNILKAFVNEVSVCFELFERDENGRLVMGEGYSKAAELIKLQPYGAITLVATEAIMENVRVTRNKDGTPKYEVNHSALLYGLALSIVESTKIGQVVRVGRAATTFLEGMFSKLNTNKKP